MKNCYFVEVIKSVIERYNTMSKQQAMDRYFGHEASVDACRKAKHELIGLVADNETTLALLGYKVSLMVNSYHIPSEDDFERDILLEYHEIVMSEVF